MKRLAAIALLTVTLGGCSTVNYVKDIWPRAHDPAMVSLWVDVSYGIDQVNCANKPTGWQDVVEPAAKLAQYTDFRADPQRKNMAGLAEHVKKMADPANSKMFCELGQKTAKDRLKAARTAWEGR
jgi:hypothetical protein